MFKLEHFGIKITWPMDSFKKISEVYGIEKFDFFGYLQIRAYFINEIKRKSLIKPK